MTGFPFGKHRGRPIEEIPTAYLLWAKSVAYGTLLEHIEFELDRRAMAGASQSNKIPHDLKSMYQQLIKEGYKSLAKKLHPDIGGNTKDMQNLNRLKDILVV